jgi:hypothetical protein
MKSNLAVRSNLMVDDEQHKYQYQYHVKDLMAFLDSALEATDDGCHHL